MIEDLITFARAKFREPENDEEPPEMVAYIWDWFCALSDWRDIGMGVGALAHVEIESWARLMRIELHPHEVETLRRLDREFRIYQDEVLNPPPPPLSEQFRAIMKSKDSG